MKTYTVECTERCGACHGSGVVANGNWSRFYAETTNQQAADVEAWAKANGFPDARHMGHEEQACGECEGVGTFTKIVSLVDALRDLCVSVPSQR